MSKCNYCDKTITKRAPGLDCKNCEVMVHTTCSGLTTKQVAAIKNFDNLAWTCKDCKRHTPTRRSLIMPEDDDDEPVEEMQFQSQDVNNISLDLKKLLEDITKQMEITIKKHIEPLEESITYSNHKLDEALNCIDILQKKLYELENKNITLDNKNKNLEFRVSTLEQRLSEIEQNQLKNKIEIAGIPLNDNTNIQEISVSVSSKLKVDYKTIKDSKVVKGTNKKDGYILLELTDERECIKWVQAAKTTKIDTGNNGTTGKNQSYKGFTVRHALTKAYKTLLWNAKKHLRPQYKYVWYKNGHVLVRKEDKDKIINIRCLEDIEKLSNHQ